MKKVVFMCAAGLVLVTTASANPAHTQISALSESQRNELFSKLLTAETPLCKTVSETFYQGSDKQGNAYWNAKCLKKKAFQIQIANNATGSTKLLDCAVIKTLNAPSCFKRIPGSL